MNDWKRLSPGDNDEFVTYKECGTDVWVQYGFMDDGEIRPQAHPSSGVILTPEEVFNIPLVAEIMKERDACLAENALLLAKIAEIATTVEKMHETWKELKEANERRIR